jgi:hypothetical protein
MSVGRDPVDRLIDVTIATPICAALVVRGAVPVLARAGGRGAMSMVDRLLRVPHEVVPEWDAERSAPRAGSNGPPEPTTVEVPELPIPGYDDLTARQVCDRLAEQAPEDLVSIARYEIANRARRTVLGKIERLTS